MKKFKMFSIFFAVILFKASITLASFKENVNDIDILSDSKYLFTPHKILTERSLKKWAVDAPKCPQDLLVDILHTYAEAGDRESLAIIAHHLFEKSVSSVQLFDACLAFQRSNFPSLAQRVGKIVLKDNIYDAYDLSKKAEIFFEIKLDQLSHEAAFRAISLVEQSSDIQESRYVGYKLAKIGNHNLAERAYMQVTKLGTDWQEIFDNYQSLKKIGKNKSAEEALKKTFDELLSLNWTPWLMWVSTQCWNEGYRVDSERAATHAIEKEENLSELPITIKKVNLLGFKDLVKKGADKLVKLHYAYPSIHHLKENIQILDDIGETQHALQLCGLGIKQCTVNFLPELVDLIDYCYKQGQKQLVQQGLRHAVKLEAPEQSIYFFNNKANHLSICRYKSSEVLLAIAQLGYSCNEFEISQDAANQSISCALAETYKSTHELSEMMDNLAINFHRLNFHTLAKKADYYKAEIEQPSFKNLPAVEPPLYEIYWTDLKGAQGVEISKKTERPCIIVSKKTSYNKGSMLTVVPLSTKKRGGITSLPFYLNNQQQEARLDQVRSIDDERLGSYCGLLPLHYQLQLKLALKNYIGEL